MRKHTIIPACILLLLSDTTSSIPVTVHPGNRVVDIWVTKANTLNATTWTIPPIDSRDETSKTTTRLADSISRSVGSTSTTPRLGKQMSQESIRTTPWTGRTTTGSGRANRIKQSANDNRAETSRRSNDTRLAERATAGTLPITLVNKLPSSNGKVYISGLDPSGALVMLGESGRWVYPTTTSGTPTPITANVALALGAPNGTQTYTLPGYVESARIWIADGTLQFFVVATPNGPGLVQPAIANPADPNVEVNYAFAELSWSAQYGIYADITNVDFVGLPLGIQLRQADNTVLSVLGTPSNAAPELCSQLTAQAKVDRQPWDGLCAYSSSGSLVRVLAPSNVGGSTDNSFKKRYFSRYVTEVWNRYRQTDLIIDTQTTPGKVACRVSGKLLQCAGDNRGYAKPNNFDIFGCNTGPFAIQAGDNAVHVAVVPRLCAAFNRATLLLPGGNVQPSLPPSQYYRNENRPAKSRPKNWYSELVHAMEVGGKGYAFSYDDVSPSIADDQSGLVGSTSPTELTVIVGGA